MNAGLRKEVEKHLGFEAVPYDNILNLNLIVAIIGRGHSIRGLPTPIDCGLVEREAAGRIFLCRPREDHHLISQ